jgi:hypothetical protein
MSISVISQGSIILASSQPAGLRKRYLDDTALEQARHFASSIPFSLDSKLRSCSTGPDIEWNPCFDTYLNRVEHLFKLHANRPKTVPGGFPAQIDAPWAWSGSEIGFNFVFQLSNEDIKEVEDALRYFKRMNQLRHEKHSH